MPTERIKILLVEDNPGDARLIHELLVEPENLGAFCTLSQVGTLGAAIAKCSAESFDVILLDLNLPDSTGLPTLQQFSQFVAQSPIIVLTGLNDNVVAFECVQNGAQSYVTKDECTSPLLRRAIHYAIERKRVEEQFRHLATHDPLTGLPNRALCYDRLSQALLRSQRDRAGNSTKWKGAVMLLDLDHFKEINDSFGHQTGDTVLQLAANRLKTCLRESDTVARLGGDEFIIILEGISERANCLSVGRNILRSLAESFSLGEGQISLGASLGISIFPDDAEEIEFLIRYADTAMYAAKRQRNQICFYKA